GVKGPRHLFGAVSHWIANNPNLEAVAQGTECRLVAIVPVIAQANEADPDSQGDSSDVFRGNENSVARLYRKPPEFRIVCRELSTGATGNQELMCGQST